MKKFAVWIMTGLALVGANVAISAAQSPENDADQPQIRERGFRGERGMRGRRGGGDPQARFSRMMDRMSEQLGLSDEQYVQFDEIVQPYQQAIAARFEKMGQIRDAEQAGDFALVDQLRGELETAQGPREMFQEMITQVEPILTTDQQQSLADIRERMQNRGRRFGEGRRMLRELPETLDMTDEQRMQYDEIMETQRAEMREKFQNMRALREELNVAEEEGDVEGADAIRQQLEANRPQFENFIPDLMSKLDPILTDTQKATFETMRAEMEQGGGGPGGPRGDRANRNRPMRLQEYFRTVQRLKLESDQKDQIRDIEKEAMMADREVKRNDRDAAAVLFKEIDGQVREVLNDDQKTQLDELVKQNDRRGRRDRERRPPR